MDERKPAGDEMDPIFFPSQAEFIAWLEEHHDQRQELWIGYHKKATGRPSLTWPETVDAALCFGWIDGVRKSINAESYKQRVTPRRKGSNWSAVNVKRIQELAADGKVRPSGLAAFEARIEAKTAVYSYEQRRDVTLGEAFESQFRANAAAWEFFQSQAAWYRNSAIWWVVSAKREETRRKRMERLITDSAEGRRIDPLNWRKAQ